MFILLFILYGVILCYGVTSIPFFRKSMLRPGVLVLFFVFRVAAGCLHNWIAYRYYPLHGDIWAFFRDSFISRRVLSTDPYGYWAGNSALPDLPHNIIIALQMGLNVFSFDNLYINTLLFSFLSYWGSIALFRAFNSLFHNNLLCSLPVLLFPSTLFWTSCIHTEGIVYLLLGFLFFYLDRLHEERRMIKKEGITQRKRAIRRGLLCLLLFLLVIFFRPGIAAGLVPALVFWLLAEKYRSDKSLAYTTPYPTILLVASILFLILAFSGVFTPVLQYISTRQQEFHILTGNSRLYLPVLEATWGSYLKVFPIAILNGFFQPLPGSGGQTIYLVFSAEGIVLWGILGFALFKTMMPGSYPTGSYSSNLPDKTIAATASGTPFLVIGITFFLFALLNLVLIGYTIPFAGAIVRYRSIFLPFLLAPALYMLRNYRILRNLNGRLFRTLYKDVS